VVIAIPVHWLTPCIGCTDTVAAIAKRKGRKRKRIQTDSTMGYREASTRVATIGLGGVKNSTLDTSRGAAEERPAKQQRCGNCRGTGHNARTCQADAVVDSALDASTSYIFFQIVLIITSKIRVNKFVVPRCFGGLGGVLRYFTSLAFWSPACRT
jgi:hypothetical protein